jgi:hypothetical protein
MRDLVICNASLEDTWDAVTFRGLIDPMSRRFRIEPASLGAPLLRVRPRGIAASSATLKLGCSERGMG